MAKIIGNTTATPNPRPDWAQTDATKADYIKNKPDIVNVQSIEKTATDGNYDTYTIFLTNGQTHSFTIRNGVDGKDGVDGVAGITHSWDGTTLTVTSASGTTSADLRGPQGIKGEMGGADGLITQQDDEGNNLLYLTCEGKIIGDGVIIPQGGGGGGGGGGGSSNNAVMTIKNTTGWLSKTIAEGSACSVSITWSSLEDELSTGNGVLKIFVGNQIKAAIEIPQGPRSIDIDKYLKPGSNTVKIEIADVYGNSRAINYTITCVAISISSYFDGTAAYTGPIAFSYIPVGAVEKTMHFLIDGAELPTQTITATNREQTYTIPAQSHGSHTLEVYFTCKIDEHDAESNHLFYDLICYVEGDETPIISVPFKTSSVKQYSTVAIPYVVYTPYILTSAIELKDNGSNKVKSLTVDRTQQLWSYKALSYGTADLSIVCGETTKDISFEVTENALDVSAETENLELYLSSEGRDNGEENPLVWSYGTVNAELTKFNLISDGWKLDEDNNTVLRVSGDARVYIPFNIFGKDFRSTGKTIEIEFATRDVLDYDAVILSSWSGNRGIQITAQKALLKSELSEIFTQYKENETVRIAFSVEKTAEHRLLSIYINGIMSGVVQYPSGDNFEQTAPVGISIGSNDCTTDIYCIRVYSNNLTRYQLLDNWIADTQNVETMIERYERNNIFDDYGNITVANLPQNLPYMILNVDNYSSLPQKKEDEKTISGSYVDPLYPGRSFTFEGAVIDVQGTSSQFYSRKNYIISFDNGFVINGVQSDTYKMRDTSMPTNVFTFKADVASSEGANNVELVRLYDEACPVKTPPQLVDSRVRQGIEGYPMLMFYGTGNNLTFLGKYNFNNDKETEEVFGFAAGDESWEILLNTTDMAVWKDDNFSTGAWTKTFKGRYPEKNTNITNLKRFASWLKSTDTTAVDTKEEKEARLAKFKDEFANYANVDAMLFNYIFTEMFLMVDNRAKNAFPTRYDADGKWLILPYDMDTAIGINNEGELKFGYELEDIDVIDEKNVFNGQDSVLYVNMRLAFKDEIALLYQNLRKREDDLFSYTEVERRFEEHQSVWGEAVFNEDARFKYIDPLINDNDNTYLPMLQGSKAEQRKWWLYNRFRYLDSKYNAGDALEDFIMLRSYGVSDIEIIPYADVYATASFDGILVQERALRGGDTYTLENPLDQANDAVISIYSASQLLSIGDLSGLKPGLADFHRAVKLSSLKVGDGAAGYDNPNLTSLTIGNLVLLRTLDVRNCSKLTQSVDVSGCTNIEHVYCEGTATTEVSLPNGGILKTLHLPGTVTNLTICNQKQLNDFTIPSTSQITTLRLENVNSDVVNALSILNTMAAGSRVRVLGMNLSMNTADEVFALMDKFDAFKGLDEKGENLDNAVIGGTIHVPALTTDDIAVMYVRYPNINITYDTLMVNVKFVDWDGITLLKEEEVPVGAVITAPTDPTRADVENYYYTFKGWRLKDGDIITDFGTAGEESLVYYAEYNELPFIWVTFYNDDVQISRMKYKPGDKITVIPSNPTRADTVDWHYEFSNWSLNGEAVAEFGTVGNENLDYRAVYKETPIISVKFYNGNVLVSEQRYIAGTAITKPADPTRDSTAQYDYEFKGWSLDGKTVVNIGVAGNANVDYYAVYDAELRYYTIRFLNDGEVLHTVFAAYGSIPTYVGDTPVDPSGSDGEFLGWVPAIVAVTGDADYVAQFETSLIYRLSGNSYDVIGVSEIVNTDIVIPSTYRGLPVTGIYDKAFYKCTSLTSITIPDSVTSIGEWAFYDCTSLTSITIPDSVTSIGSNAFSWCTSLTSVTIGDSVSSIGDYAFIRCTSLTSITIPDSVTSIGNGVLQNCHLLTSVIIGDSVTSIGDYAFEGCTSLTSVTIPDSVTSIGGYAFEDCTSLENITFKGEIPSYDYVTMTSVTTVIIGEGATHIPDEIFGAWESLTSVVIGNNVASIGAHAFAGCINLTSVVIPNGVTSIGGEAFYDCDSLTDVYYCGTQEQWDLIPIGVNNENLTNATRYYYSESEPTTEGFFWHWVDGVPTIWIECLPNNFKFTYKSNGDGTCIVSKNATYAKTYTDIVIPEVSPEGWVVTSIGNDAFQSTSITSATIPDSVTSIGEDAFAYCFSLASIVIPDSVTSIGHNAFWYCSKLTSVTTNENSEHYKSVDGNLYTQDGKTLVQYAIGKTDKEFIIPDGVMYIREEAFLKSGYLTSVVISNSVTTIGDWAFYYCTSLTSITIGDSVTSIGYAAFHNCSSLTSITIPDSVTSIGDAAFRYCSNLASIVVGDNVTRIGHSVFEYCSKLQFNKYDDCDYLGSKNSSYFALIKMKSKAYTSYDIHPDAKVIAERAFYGSRMTSVTIPDSVIGIGDMAFYNCSELTDVYYTGTEEEWNQIVVGDDNRYLTDATIHYNYTG